MFRRDLKQISRGLIYLKKEAHSKFHADQKENMMPVILNPKLG